MNAENYLKPGGLWIAHLSPEIVHFFLSSIQGKFVLGFLLLPFSLIPGILVGLGIDWVARLLLCECCGRISASPAASPASSVPATLPSFVVRATCGGPMFILRSASSASCRSRSPWVCTEVPSASYEGWGGPGHLNLRVKKENEGGGGRG